MDRDERDEELSQPAAAQPAAGQPAAGQPTQPAAAQPTQPSGPDPAAGQSHQEAAPSPEDQTAGAPWWYEPHSAPGPWAAHEPISHGAPAPGTPGAPGWPNVTPGSGGPAAGQAPDPPGYPGHAPYPGQPAGGYGYGSGAGGGGPWAAGGGWGWGHPGGWGGPPAGGHRPIRSPRRWATAVTAGAVAAAAVLVGVGVGYGIWNGGSTPVASSSQFTPHRHTTSVTPSTSKASTASGAPSNSTTIAKKVDPGLVDINTVLGYQTEQAAGTGMVLTSTGKVLTNNHVIEGSTSISVTDLGNGRTYSATVLGYSRTNDVALIQLTNASGLQTVSIGSSTSVKVGQSVVGIGNAGGVGGTPSVAGGSVTALNQAITASDQGSLGTTTEHLTGLIESNANIQPGDSGGPLVDTTGKVVGMDTAASAAQGYSISGAATGQGYSIPINSAMTVIHQIEAQKASTSVHIGGTAFLGVYVGSTSTTTGSGTFGRTPTATPSTTTPGSASGTNGALVVGVIAGTPAKSSGITQGDVITGIGGQSVGSVTDVTKIVMGYHPGQSVKVTWTTPAGSSQTATITLAKGPAD